VPDPACRIAREQIPEGPISRIKLKQDWDLSAESFQRFLDWLGAGGRAQGEHYLEMRRRLVGYFDRKGCLDSNNLADETLNRVARRLEEEGTIEAASPAQYCYIVARFVFFEYLRRGDHAAVPFEDATQPGATVPRTQIADEREAESEEAVKRFGCLEHCLATLPASDRELILAYYSGERSDKIEQRKQIARRLGLSPNALTIKACRIRARIEDCVNGCLGGE
jgi:DNA-directed RNA polymerase specialized sigma24 family protein